MPRKAMPQWQKDFKKRMTDQLKLFAKAKDRPDRLTKWTYTNGCLKVSRYGYDWVPNPKP